MHRRAGRLGPSGAQLLMNAIDEFSEFLSIERSAAVATISGYGTDLAQLAEFVRAPRGANWWESVNPSTVQEFIEELKRRKYADTSVARKASAIRSFFAFLQAKGFMHANPAEGVMAPRSRKSVPRTISPTEVEMLLAGSADLSRPERKRNRAMLELLYATGMRVTELLSLNVADLQLRGRNPCVRRLGKGGREQVIGVHDQAVKALQEYLLEVRPILVGDANQQALFVSRRGERLTRQGFWISLRAYARAVGIDREVSPETLRHSFAFHRREMSLQSSARAS